MLSQGTIDLDTPEFTLTLVRSSQTVAALKPKGAGDFDFTPGDLLISRSHDGYFHLGDITLHRLAKMEVLGNGRNYSTATARAPVAVLPRSKGVLAAADLTPTLPADLPLQVTRSWVLESGKLVLRFELKNKSSSTVEIGALGIPMVFNNVLNDRSLEEAHAKCSFYDPYIGEDAGYLQVTRLSGHGPSAVGCPGWQDAPSRLKQSDSRSGKPVGSSACIYGPNTEGNHVRRFLRVDGSQSGLCRK